VEPMLSVLEEHGVRVPTEEASNVRAGTILCIGGVVIDALDWDDGNDAVSAINLLPKKLLPSETGALAFAWHTAVMLAVLFAVTFMSVTGYLDNESTIQQRRRDLTLNVPAIPVSDPSLLEKKVDSLNQVHLSLTQSLHVLDSLLIGSDKWSRFLERLTNATGSRSGLWLMSVVARGGEVTLRGSARTRNRVADFARDLEGSVRKLTSIDVTTRGGEVRLYTFEITTRINKSELPEVAMYLREAALNDDFTRLPLVEDRMPPGFESTPMTSVQQRRSGNTNGGQ